MPAPEFYNAIAKMRYEGKIKTETAHNFVVSC
jgi:hypothetical protein